MPDRTALPDPESFPPALRDAILSWYSSRGRSLPFRRTTDPYAILVSEAMAQQTQAARAGESWIRFMDAYPTAAALAAATPADVLRAWQGLGYNRRALNLWRAARRIVEVHGGRVPADLGGLQQLPGVGPYTARAIAAIAFGLPVGAVDTNVRRVLGRIVTGEAGAMSAAALQELADAAVPSDRPGAWTQALMDLGATLCRPRQMDCAQCPAEPWCRSARNAPAAASKSAGTIEPAGAGKPRLRPVAVRPKAASGRAVRETPASFVTTSRWLRGRIVDRLRAAEDGVWTEVDGPIGEHDRAAVGIALDALAHDGLVELDEVAANRRRRARLAMA